MATIMDFDGDAMHFLILTQYFPPETGGPPVRLGAMTRQLSRLGHEVEIVTALPNYPTGEIYPDYRGQLFSQEEWEGIPRSPNMVSCFDRSGNLASAELLLLRGDIVDRTGKGSKAGLRVRFISSSVSWSAGNRGFAALGRTIDFQRGGSLAGFGS
jgi:hypothetical protein